MNDVGRWTFNRLINRRLNACQPSALGWFMTRLLGVLAIFGPLFYLFAYNSGYGYDALEYLIIARSLNEGHVLYDFIPSKSYLLYSSTNVLLNLLGGYNHVSVSLLITLLAIGVLVSAWRAGLLFGERTALFTVILTAVACFFSEMNFLEPESWVAILGLNAFTLAVSNGGKPVVRWLGAGFLLGMAMCFKSVAAFYLVGFGAYIFLLWVAGRLLFWPMVGRGIITLAGFVLPLLGSVLYFYLTHRLEAHLEWTYIYPFSGYPAHTLFLAKFFAKLSWFLVLLGVSVFLVVQRPYRTLYLQTPALWLVVLLALFACVPMLKTQASHYFFQAAVFFALHMGVVFAKALTQHEQQNGIIHLQRLAPALGLLGIGAVTTLFWYRPDAVQRFLSIKDYSGEEQAGAYIRQKVGPNGHALIVDQALPLYFASDRGPNVPFIFTEMQTTHYLESHPDTYGKALADSSLKLVVFGNRSSIIDDSTAIHKPANAYALRQLRAGLQQHFVQVNDPQFPLTYWVRK